MIAKNVVKAKPGRPRKPAGHRVKSIRTIALTEEERDRIEQSTGNLDISTNKFLRASVLYCLDKINPKGEMIDFDALTELMSKIEER